MYPSIDIDCYNIMLYKGVTKADNSFLTNGKCF